MNDLSYAVGLPLSRPHQLPLNISSYLFPLSFLPPLLFFILLPLFAHFTGRTANTFGSLHNFIQTLALFSRQLSLTRRCTSLLVMWALLSFLWIVLRTALQMTKRFAIVSFRDDPLRKGEAKCARDNCIVCLNAHPVYHSLRAKLAYTSANCDNVLGLLPTSNDLLFCNGATPFRFVVDAMQQIAVQFSLTTPLSLNCSVELSPVTKQFWHDFIMTFALLKQCSMSSLITPLSIPHIKASLSPCLFSRPFPILLLSRSLLA
ncbi:hypothetical protein EmuJ_000033800 [Echinococcus multilocularis]|uniref:Uncharacterized protein n=1 Tax=Echinococcus multilocularis TaxID=6211 RepID=A0A087VWL6_ECHMU|nr:hypothetical protein EmuJ_000033800 [Echinococcus multilocularis]